MQEIYGFKMLRTKLMYMPYTRYNFLVHELLYKMYMYSSIYKSVSMLFIIVLISQILKSWNTGKCMKFILNILSIFTKQNQIQVNCLF